MKQRILLALLGLVGVVAMCGALGWVIADPGVLFLLSFAIGGVYGVLAMAWVMDAES